MFRIVRTMVTVVAVVTMCASSAQAYTVSGLISTFGPPYDRAVEKTADGGTDARSCIAIRDDWSLGDYFYINIPAQIKTGWHKYHGVILHCDWGPAEWTGRSIDISGQAAEGLGIRGGFPTDARATATLVVKKHTRKRHRHHRRHVPLRR